MNSARSCRRTVTTLVGRLLAVSLVSSVLFAALWAGVFWSQVAPLSEEHNEGLRVENPDATVLFPVDDSGGVSGRCRNVQSTDVLVVDELGQRYDTIRFFLELWRACSWPESWMPVGADSAEVPPHIPRQQVGLMRFVATYMDCVGSDKA